MRCGISFSFLSFLQASIGSIGATPWFDDGSRASCVNWGSKVSFAPRLAELGVVDSHDRA
jgi:hypothetical protein